jgi:excisionase family DNA binding protein
MTPTLCLRIPEAAEAIGIKRARLYQMIAAGMITAHKIGARTVVKRTEIDRFLASLPEAEIGQRRAA